MSSLDNDYQQQQQENMQEEAYQYSIIKEFANLVLAVGPNAVLSQIDPEAKEELLLALKGV